MNDFSWLDTAVLLLLLGQEHICIYMYKYLHKTFQKSAYIEKRENAVSHGFPEKEGSVKI